MKIVIDHLRAWVDLPDDAALRGLFDDVGLEVKRAGPGPHGLTFTLELLANRGDHRCYAGVARELMARLGGELRLPPWETLTPGPAPVSVRCESERCLVYTLTLLEGGAGGRELDARARAVLEGAGLHPVHPVVDASNLALLELGQPTHAFDADRVEGAVVVRESRAGERAWPLFAAEPVELPAGTLVIADEAKILAVAGVIGCEESKTTAATRRVLLESATFDPVAVRKAARALGLVTDASMRFERGGDPSAPLVGAGRVVRLLESTGDWRRVGATAVLGGWTDPRRVIGLDLARARAMLGAPLADAAERLRRLGFGVEEAGDRLRVTVPPGRLWDVEGEADLHEELARVVGYNALATVLPPVTSGAVPSEAEDRRERVEEVLLGAGFLEMVTNGFYSRQLVEALGIDDGHPLAAHVETLNALDRGYSLLKNNALAQAVETVAANVRLKNPHVRAFEWTRTFHPTGAASLADRRSPCTERPVLWAVLTGPTRPAHWADKAPEVDLWYVAGLVDAIAAELRLPLELEAGDPADPVGTLLHPYRQARVTLRGVPVGRLGEVHPAIGARLKLRGVTPWYLELDAEPLLHAPTEPLRYAEPPAIPPMRRQLTLVLPEGVEAGTVVAAMRGAAPAGLEAVEVIDVFALDEGARAVTFDLVWTAGRTADEVNADALALAGVAGVRVPGVRLRG